jgi:murein DD-endopeptidase MepM/ murein hydrolase activator NlpD
MNRLARIIVMCTIVATTLSGVTIVGADDIYNQIDGRRQQMTQLETDIAGLEASIAELRGQEAEINNQIAILDLELEKTQKELELLKAQLEQLTNDIVNITAEIEQMQRDLETQVEVYKQNVNYYYIEYVRSSPLEVLVTSDNLSDFVRKQEQQSMMNSVNENILEDIKTIKASLESQKADLELKQAEVASLKQDVEAKERTLAEQINVKQALLAQTQNMAISYEQLVAQNQQAMEDLDGEIRYLEQEAARREEELRRQREQRGEDPSIPIISEDGFIWPASGTITMEYNERYPDWILNAYPWFKSHPNHTGIDIANSVGTPIKAASSGIVATVRSYQGGYGNCIIIDHGGGLMTLYGHLNSFNVSEGQYVVIGDVIGGMGSTGSSTGPHLHFETRLNGSVVNPHNYLPS